MIGGTRTCRRTKRRVCELKLSRRLYPGINCMQHVETRLCVRGVPSRSGFCLKYELILMIYTRQTNNVVLKYYVCRPCSVSGITRVSDPFEGGGLLPKLLEHHQSLFAMRLARPPAAGEGAGGGLSSARPSPLVRAQRWTSCPWHTLGWCEKKLNETRRWCEASAFRAAW